MTSKQPVHDDRLLFSREEFIAAFTLIVPQQKAETWADELLQPVPDGVEDYHTHLSDDVLDLLSLVSDDCAERVEKLFGLTPELAEARRREFRRKIAREE